MLYRGRAGFTGGGGTVNRTYRHQFASGCRASWDEHWQVISFQTPASFGALVEYDADSQHVYIDGTHVERERIEFTLPAAPQ